ncbi:hypothetical protein ACS3UN_12345 [Oscillospiraceae bacterium LTW-04]|nr:hypothetical protein RBH76_00145 [Oscillospiraceae bacterium MB24-C1]
MKRLSKKFSVLCLIAAAILSLTIGVGLPRIQAFASNTISRLFPVAYQITYRNTDAQPVIAPAHFLADNAIITTPSGDTAIPLSDAVFVCLQNELRTQNILRSGLLTALIILAAVSLTIALVAAAFSNQKRKALTGSKRHTRTTPRYTAACVHRVPTMPSVA